MAHAASSSERLSIAGALELILEHVTPAEVENVALALQADGLALIPRGSEALAVGTLVDYLPLQGF